METAKLYVLPKLPYDYKDLVPYISEEQLKIHHTKHHQAYVNGANSILTRIDSARKENIDIDMKSTLKELSWNIGGHRMHSLFWENLGPSKKVANKPEGALNSVIEAEFGNFERFKKEFTQTANSVEGSGWAALTFDRYTRRPIIMQVEKHNNNIYPGFDVLMVLDVFEHAYYIDYKNDRGKFVEAFWSIANWEKVSKRFQETAK